MFFTLRHHFLVSASLDLPQEPLHNIFILLFKICSYFAYNNYVSGPSSLVENLLIQVIKNQEEIKATQKVHSSLITNLLRNMDSSPSSSTLPEGVSFPVKTVLELEELERRLSDPVFNKDIVSTGTQSFFFLLKLCNICSTSSD